LHSAAGLATKASLKIYCCRFRASSLDRPIGLES